MEDEVNVLIGKEKLGLKEFLKFVAEKYESYQKQKVNFKDGDLDPQ